MPSVRSRFVRANQRSKCRKSGVPDRAVISWMMASGSALATASPIPTASSPSTTTGSAPIVRMASVDVSFVVVPVTWWPRATSIGTSRRPTAPFAPATKTRMVGPPFSLCTQDETGQGRVKGRDTCGPRSEDAALPAGQPVEELLEELAPIDVADVREVLVLSL